MINTASPLDADVFARPAVIELLERAANVNSGTLTEFAARGIEQMDLAYRDGTPS